MCAATEDPEAIDLRWMGGLRRIASWRIGDVLVDCGPATTVATLQTAIAQAPPRALLLTHIHFDHAGAAGELVRRFPELEVVVHERGARHLAEPERLERSARRVFGERFDELFGPLTPIPEGNLTVVRGGELVHGLRVLYTPGHAVHHVAYVQEDTGRVFPGDVTGMRLREGGPILPPTPPPDIDVVTWRASIDTLRQLAPAWLGLPHFGAVTDAGTHLEQAEAALCAHEQAASNHDEAGYVAWARAELGDDAAENDEVSPLQQNYAGLTRWLDRRDESQLTSG